MFESKYLCDVRTKWEQCSTEHGIHSGSVGTYGTLEHMQTYVIANWKMNPTIIADAKRLAVGTKKACGKEKAATVVVCPPFPYIGTVAPELKGSTLALGVQDLSHEKAGAFTGQVSASMLASFKARYAIVGHSERRALGETNELVAAKARAALDAGMRPIVCIGERERGEDGAYYTYVRDEVQALLDVLKRKEIADVLIAYEPVWAIGKPAEEAMTTDALFEMQLFIRKLVAEKFGRPASAALTILYGGAVKSENAADLMEKGGVQGLLVGSASLDPKEFSAIVAAAVAPQGKPEKALGKK